MRNGRCLAALQVTVPARSGFEPYVGVNRRTGAFISKEDMELLEECERRGIIEISK